MLTKKRLPSGRKSILSALNIPTVRYGKEPTLNRNKVAETFDKSREVRIESPRFLPVSRVSGAVKLWIQPLDSGEPKLMSEFETDRIFDYD